MFFHFKVDLFDEEEDDDEELIIEKDFIESQIEENTDDNNNNNNANNINNDEINKSINNITSRYDITPILNINTKCKSEVTIESFHVNTFKNFLVFILKVNFGRLYGLFVFLWLALVWGGGVNDCDRIERNNSITNFIE